ncbi:MAG: DUF1592 domain-containing protein [Verrucomicrobiota bacterium]
MRLAPPSLLFIALVCLTLGPRAVSGVPVEETQAGWADQLDTFFDRHCYDCHDDLTTKAGLDLFELKTDLADEATFATWELIYDRVSKGEMPPRTEERPSPQAIAALKKILAPPLAKAHESQKGTILRRLNRAEYENTLNELLGLNLDIIDRLPEDGRSHEFDTVGSALGISQVQLERYLEIAEIALDEVLMASPEAPERTRIETSFTDNQDVDRFLGNQWLKAPDGAVVFFRQYGYPTGSLRESRIPMRGRYRVKVTGYAYQSEDPVTFSLRGTTFKRGGERPVFGYFSMPPGKPTTIETEVLIDRDYMLQIEAEELFDPQNLIKNEGVKKYAGPGLAIKQVVIEGPILDTWPPTGHRLILGDSEEAEPIAKTLQRFASAAFRRPVSVDELEPYLQLHDAELTSGADSTVALRTALSAILCAPDFIYLRENPGWLTSHQLANRLSYFLNRTTPDAALREQADSGKLSSDPELLLAESRRLMQSGDFDRFINDFTDAWLDLREIDFTNPDASLYPEFDAYLQHSMVAETRAYWRELIEENLPVTYLVKSDFAMLNKRLGRHYGIPAARSAEVERVSLPADSVRGGFMAQGSVLKVTANGSNTSPVLRGVWINERILGNHPHPPPAGTPGVEPDIRGATTLRELLAQHRDSESCQACHELIDPPGFALESFNPIGGWRTYFRSMGQGERPEGRAPNGQGLRYKIGPDVDASGVLLNGTPFDDYISFRELIADQPEALARNLIVKLLTFSTGREMGFSDRPEINQLTARAKAADYRIADLFEIVITSKIFRRK